MDIGNMQKHLIKMVCVVLEISCRTYRQMHSYLSQYFATALTGEVIKEDKNHCLSLRRIIETSGI